MTAAEQEVPGWRTAEISYLRPYDIVCALCGQLVPGRYWEAEADGELRRFCSPDHADRFETYRPMKHGTEA